jgi:hypothetical protein
MGYNGNNRGRTHNWYGGGHKSSTKWGSKIVGNILAAPFTIGANLSKSGGSWSTSVDDDMDFTRKDGIILICIIIAVVAIIDLVAYLKCATLSITSIICYLLIVVFFWINISGYSKHKKLTKICAAVGTVSSIVGLAYAIFYGIRPAWKPVDLYLICTICVLIGTTFVTTGFSIKKSYGLFSIPILLLLLILPALDIYSFGNNLYAGGHVKYIFHRYNTYYLRRNMSEYLVDFVNIYRLKQLIYLILTLYTFVYTIFFFKLHSSDKNVREMEQAKKLTGEQMNSENG